MMETDEWSLKEYHPKDSSEIWFFRKNLAPSVSAGAKSHEHVVYLTFHFQPRDTSGFPTNQDENTLFDIENYEIPKLEQDGLAVLVGAVLKPGIKDLIFYTRDPQGFLQAAIPIRDNNPQFCVECEISPDPEWGQYHDLP